MTTILRKARYKELRIVSPESKCQNSFVSFLLRGISFILVACFLFALGYNGSWHDKFDSARNYDGARTQSPAQ
ncbi:MAG: hypothetical protein KDD62_05225 [Bdellovibrionales bacterium]|nr:hypothetical protein [Bdellovibrionales bacterium]